MTFAALADCYSFADNTTLAPKRRPELLHPGKTTQFSTETFLPKTTSRPTTAYGPNSRALTNTNLQSQHLQVLLTVTVSASLTSFAMDLFFGV